MELTCQTRKLPGAFGIWTVAGGTLRNSRLGNTFFEDLLSCGCELLGSATKGLGIEVTKMLGKARYNCGAQRVRHTKHKFIFASMFDKGP